MSLNRRRFTATELRPGALYRVNRDFKDYDGVIHLAGERWRFLAKNFLPYEDGLTLLIEQDGRQSAIRLQWREETQGNLIERFSDFVGEAVD
jgi:hypothetical protein